MKAKQFLAVAAVIVVVQIPLAAQAFECPARFKDAQAAIDKVAADMKAVGSKVSKADMGLVHALLDDAKSQLSSGTHNHEKPQGPYDHARAVAKAKAARGYAEAAGGLLAHYAK
jgi:type IV secretory pathway TrbL component